MKMNRKETGDGVAYARKEPYEWDGTQYEADILHGDIVTIKDAGITESHPQWGDQYKFMVETRNGDRRTNFNQSTINALVDAYGDESENYVGKKVKVWTRKDVIGGKKVIIAFFLPSGFVLDEFGDVEQQSTPTPRPDVPPQEKSEGQKQVEEAQALDPEDVPFN